MLKYIVIFLLFVSYNEAKNIRIFKNDDKYLSIGVTKYSRATLFWQAIFPGTKWCGDGDIAEDYDDLGYFKELDMCCRDHDYCPKIIHSGETKYNLTNDGLFTKLLCKCDSDFYDCLHDTDSSMADVVGTAYFTALGAKCFMEEHPIVGCVEYQKVGFAKRCVEYAVDEGNPKVYQWFDVPFY